LKNNILLLFILLLFISGCISSSAEPGLCNITAQSEYTLNTKQVCINPENSIKVADLAWLLSLNVLVEDRYITDRRKAVESLNEGVNLVCLIELPEPCCIGGGCTGPYQEGIGTPARKAGCANDYFAWASISWPPVCTEAWPDEPHCTTSEFVETVGWAERLRHEVFNMAVLRWVKIRDPSYLHRIYTETEPKMAQQFRLLMQNW
jgi:hypothetical protein